MIKIIKEGKTIHTKECPYCEALLEYSSQDINYDRISSLSNYYQNYQKSYCSFIICPECGNKIILESAR